MPPCTRDSAIVKDTSKPFERRKYRALHTRSAAAPAPADNRATHARCRSTYGVYVDAISDIEHIPGFQAPQFTCAQVTTRMGLERADFLIGRTQNRIESTIEPECT